MKNPVLKVRLGGLELKNPVILASGTVGYGEEYGSVLDVNRLGGIVVKGISLFPRSGHPAPRLCEVPAGMLNAVGLHNVGLDAFIREKIPYLRTLDTVVIVNIFGESRDEYEELARRLDGLPGVCALEVNISCPNVKRGGMLFGTDPLAAYDLLSAVRKVTGLPLIAKLSPNVTDIVEIARAARDAGMDALSLINTFPAMAIDVETSRPKISNIIGGLSGPAIHPIAVRLVWEVAGAVDLPLIGIGGITGWEDAVEFILAGATAVAIGTANFINPLTAIEVLEGIERYLVRKGRGDINEIRGGVTI